ncbi:UDP-glycosyltransferase 87A2-like [Dioscorea cayenensis subsp. rotundata]|uniref:Glycosyltransferase n=1 Tax=Dioscorea cayennensis subsp. rotundata TaxID=55577 RepID=A0AB40C8M3_DIOCR|nr:UDP-glycosyltransferase 87A2-like [Dioscorea cayenensis subsp. rotundata]
MASDGSSTPHHHHHHQHHLAFIPWPGRGHINPMLNLARSLASKAENIIITFIVTEEWLNILHSSTSFPPNLLLVSIPNILASEHTRGADMMSFIHTVFTLMGGPIEKILLKLVNDSVDVIIADALLPWMPGISVKLGVPLVSVFTMSVSLFLGAHLHGKETNEFQEYVPNKPSNSPLEIIRQKFRESMSRSEKSKSIIFTSVYELENEAIDTLKSKLQIPIYCLGSAIPSILNDNTSIYHKWLDSKPCNSVLYVSLGSFMPISRAQLDEMVHGLNASGVFFLLVVRGEEFQRVAELCKNTGFVLQWCDQFSVLCHDSVGGFLTHCGWNSTLEAIYAGVPMLTFPLVWDQLPNSKLIVDKWKVGLRLKVEGKEEEIVGREEIARIACQLMDSDSENGKELRKKAGELAEICRKAFGDGASCSSGFDAFIRDVLMKPSISEQKL